MVKAIVTIKIMPESPEVDLAELEKGITIVISKFDGIMKSVEKQPIGFGLISLVIKFAVDESKGTEEIEDELRKVSGVESTQVTMISRALG